MRISMHKTARRLIPSGGSDGRKKPSPLEPRVSSRLLEVGRSNTPSKAHSKSKLSTMAKTSSFLSSKSEGDGASHDRNESAVASYVERYSRRYPDKELAFTDKDRAAAVAMGARDIKVSLQVKKKRERKQDEPGEREFQIRFALAEKELRNSNPNRALQFINQALELRPSGRECFVARSRCHLMLGQIEAALTDAETALSISRDYIKAMYAKAEALYALGDFEHALVYFHRGHQLRPELEEFRLGIQKAEEAILNVIGDLEGLDIKDSGKIQLSRSAARKYNSTPMVMRTSSGSRSSANMDKWSLGALGDLNIDIEFMQRILNGPELSDLKPFAHQQIKDHIDEALDFLQSRQEFWAQQRPQNAKSRTQDK